MLERWGMPMHAYLLRIRLCSLGSAVFLATIAAPTVHARADAATVRVLVELTSSAETVPADVAGVELDTAEQLGTHAPATYVDDGKTVRAPDLRRWHTIEVAAEDAGNIMAELREQPEIVRVDIAGLYYTTALPNDSLFSEQYALTSAVNPVADIDAPAAWDRTTGSGNTIIAVVDGGIDLTHEDLAGKIWVNSDEVAGNGVDDDHNGYADDVHGWNFYDNEPAAISSTHATHVAGIAAAESNNGRGITGVDWGARIMSVRVLSSGGAGHEDDIIRGIEYAVANGADVINLSLAGSSSSSALFAAIENAYASGAVVVAAAGNNGRNTGIAPQYPACADVNGVDMVIGVAATNDEGEPWGSSNYGPCVNIAAPGVKIESTKPNNSYGTMSGTSMAAPHVAGVAGLYLALHPTASAAEVIAAINQGEAFTGEDAGTWNEEYKGKLNAARVVNSGSATSQNDPPASEPSSGGGGDGGGDGDNNGGGGGGGGGEPEPPAVKKPAVLGVRTASISSADRAAPDFIQNPTVPAVVAKLFSEVYGRPILAIESTYWKLRARSDKATVSKLRGAMQWQKLKGKTYDPKGVAGASASSSASSTLLNSVSYLFQQIFKRVATTAELTYWRGRVTRGEKTTITALQGAMQWHRAQGLTVGQ